MQPLRVGDSDNEGDASDVDVTPSGGQSPAVLPAAQAYSKRWVREAGASPGATTHTTLPALPASPSAARKVQWEVGLAGYKQPGGDVTEDQIRAAAGLLQGGPSRIAGMLKDPGVRTGAPGGLRCRPSMPCVSPTVCPLPPPPRSHRAPVVWLLGCVLVCACVLVCVCVCPRLRVCV
jgi:hypothetical protein